MDRQTESEAKVSKIFTKVLATPITKEPKLSESIENISITPYIFTDDIPKVMLLTMPLDLLIYAKVHSAELLSTLRKEFPKYMILMRRAGEIPASKVFAPVKSREEIISDIVFPAIVSARLNEVESKEDMSQLVYLDGKNQCWNKPELATLEKLMCTVFGQNFKVKIFGSGF